MSAAAGDTFHTIRKWLQKPGAEQSVAVEDRLFQRLVTAYHQYGRGAAGWRDLTTLVHCLLRREQEWQGHHGVSIRLPADWPAGSREAFESSGLHVMRANSADWVVSATPWMPPWLPQKTFGPVDSSFFADTCRRTPDQVDGDPALRVLGLEQYRSSAQCTAVRAALSLPTSGTLLIVLPTGGGKSLCFQILSAVSPAVGGTVVVIVPTVALALDQERAMARIVPHPTAYYSGGVTEKERNSQIKDRIRLGTQCVVFTSPEACLLGLESSLTDAAAAGLLRCLAVDECHMVEHWGDGFRPAFQELAGLRRSLLCRARAPFPTILLSATVTQSSVEALHSLFGDPGPFGVVASVQLRPEPDFQWVHCADEQSRQERLLEALVHLPRPAILYVTKREDCERWLRLLKEFGWSRTQQLHGETPNEERQALILAWSKGEIDIMVATSAFGLGVDQCEVRCVIHACVPESVDRLYQEIGRGGRDGKSSLALVLSIDTDFWTAEALSGDILISVDKGLARWSAMFYAKRSGQDGLWEVPLDVRPAYAAADAPNRYHTMWNIRTLNLMSKARLIRLEGRVDRSLEEETKAASIRILDDEHLRLETWLRKVEALRREEYVMSQQHMQWLRQLAASEQCASQIFQQLYRINPPGIGGWLEVSRSCGGCAYCSRNGVHPFAGEPPQPAYPWPASHALGTPLAALMKHQSSVWVLYRTGGSEHYRILSDFITYLLVNGVKNLVMPRTTWEMLSAKLSIESWALPFVHSEYTPGFIPPLPTAVYVPAGTTLPAHLYKGFPAPLIAIAEEGALDPQKPWCSIRDTLKCYSLEALGLEYGL